MRLILLLTAGVLAACAARPSGAWQPERAEAVAWWIEDVAHGLPRTPDELSFLPANERDAAIARWAAGSDLAGRWQPPRQLAARRARWPELAAAVVQGEALALMDTGLLAPAPGVEPQRRAAVAALVDAENNDRRFVDGLVLTLGAPDPAVESVYRREVLAARWTLAAAAGR